MGLKSFKRYLQLHSFQTGLELVSKYTPQGQSRRDPGEDPDRDGGWGPVAGPGCSSGPASRLPERREKCGHYVPSWCPETEKPLVSYGKKILKAFLGNERRVLSHVIFQKWALWEEMFISFFLSTTSAPSLATLWSHPNPTTMADA